MYRPYIAFAVAAVAAGYAIYHVCLAKVLFDAEVMQLISYSLWRPSKYLCMLLLLGLLLGEDIEAFSSGAFAGVGVGLYTFFTYPPLGFRSSGDFLIALTAQYQYNMLLTTAILCVLIVFGTGFLGGLGGMFVSYLLKHKRSTLPQ